MVLKLPYNVLANDYLYLEVVKSVNSAIRLVLLEIPFYTGLFLYSTHQLVQQPCSRCAIIKFVW